MELDEEIEALLENASVSSNEELSDEELDLLLNDFEQLDSPKSYHQNDHEQLKDSPIHERLCEVSTSKDEVDIEEKFEEEGEIETLDASEESSSSNRPTKVIKLTSTGRFNHIKPLRTDKRKPPLPRPRLAAGSRMLPSPWVKSVPRVAHEAEPSLHLETTPPRITPNPPKPCSFSMPVFNTVPLIVGQKRQLRSELRGFPQTSSTKTSTSLFSKRSFNFSASRSSSFGAGFGSHVLQAQSDKFNLTHLK